MSTITTLAVLAVVVVFGLPILGTYTGSALDANAQSIQDKQDAQDFGNNAGVGDIVCDLYLKVNGELDESKTNKWFELNAFDPLIVYLDENNFLIYEWQETSCYQVGTNSFIPLIAYNFNTGSGTGTSLQTNSLLPNITFGDSFGLELTGYGPNGKLLTAKSTEKRWEEEVKIDDLESVNLPIGFTEEFFLRQVVVADYSLEFRAINQSINDEDTNKPLITFIKGPTFR